MPDTCTISPIQEDDWRAAQHALEAKGWSLTRGGGVDHSWATLSKDGMYIEMEYDRWMDGDMSFALTDEQKVLSDLPEGFAKKHGFVER